MTKVVGKEQKNVAEKKKKFKLLKDINQAKTQKAKQSGREKSVSKQTSKNSRVPKSCSKKKEPRASTSKDGTESKKVKTGQSNVGTDKSRTKQTNKSESDKSQVHVGTDKSRDKKTNKHKASIAQPKVDSSKSVKFKLGKKGIKSKNRIQLKLKKVKEYRTVGSVSEYSVTTKKVWNSHRMDSPQACKKDKHSKGTDVTAKSLGSHIKKEKLLFKYKKVKQTDETVYNHLVRPSHRQKIVKNEANKIDIERKRSKSTKSDHSHSEKCDKANKTSKSESKNAESCELDTPPFGKVSSNKGKSNSKNIFGTEDEKKYGKRMNNGNKHEGKKKNTNIPITKPKPVPCSKAKKTSLVGKNVAKKSIDGDVLNKCAFCCKTFSCDKALISHYTSHVPKRKSTNATNKRATKYTSKRQTKNTKRVQINSEPGLKPFNSSNLSDMNGCEIIDLSKSADMKNANSDKYFEVELSMTSETDQSAAETAYSELDERSRVPSAESCNSTSSKLPFNYGESKLYCTHDTDLAQACMKTSTRVRISPIRISKGELGDYLVSYKEPGHGQPDFTPDVCSVARVSSKHVINNAGSSIHRNISGKKSLKMIISKKMDRATGKEKIGTEISNHRKKMDKEAREEKTRTQLSYHRKLSSKDKEHNMKQNMKDIVHEKPRCLKRKNNILSIGKDNGKKVCTGEFEGFLNKTDIRNSVSNKEHESQVTDASESESCVFNRCQMHNRSGRFHRLFKKSKKHKKHLYTNTDTRSEASTTKESSFDNTPADGHPVSTCNTGSTHFKANVKPVFGLQRKYEVQGKLKSMLALMYKTEADVKKSSDISISVDRYDTDRDKNCLMEEQSDSLGNLGIDSIVKEKSDAFEDLFNDSLVEEKSDTLEDQNNDSIIEENSDTLEVLDNDSIVEETSVTLGDLDDDLLMEEKSDTLEDLGNDSVVEEKSVTLEDLGNDSVVEEKSVTVGDLGNDRVVEEISDTLEDLGNDSVVEEISDTLEDQINDSIIEENSDTLDVLDDDSIVDQTSVTLGELDDNHLMEEKSDTLEDLGNDSVVKEKSDTLEDLGNDSVVEEISDTLEDLGNDSVVDEKSDTLEDLFDDSLVEEKFDTFEDLGNDSVVEEKSDTFEDLHNDSVVEEKSDTFEDLGDDSVVKEKSDTVGDLANDSVVEEKSDTLEDLGNDSVVEEKSDTFEDLHNDSVVEEKSDTFEDLANDSVVEEKSDTFEDLHNDSVVEEKSDIFEDLGNDSVVEEKSDTVGDLANDSVVEEKSDTLEDLGNDSVVEKKSDTLEDLGDGNIVEKKSDTFGDIINDSIVEENFDTVEDLHNDNVVEENIDAFGDQGDASLMEEKSDTLGDLHNDNVVEEKNDTLGDLGDACLMEEKSDTLGGQVNNSLVEKISDTFGGLCDDCLMEEKSDMLADLGNASLMEEKLDTLEDLGSASIVEEKLDRLGDQGNASIVEEKSDRLGDLVNDNLIEEISDKLGDQVNNSIVKEKSDTVGDVGNDSIVKEKSDTVGDVGNDSTVEEKSDILENLGDDSVVEEKSDTLEDIFNDSVVEEKSDTLEDLGDDSVVEEKSDTLEDIFNDSVVEEKSDTLEDLGNDSVVEEKSDALEDPFDDSLVEEKSDTLEDLDDDPLLEEKSDTLEDQVNDSIVEENSDKCEGLDNDSIVEDKSDMLGDLGNANIVEEQSDSLEVLNNDSVVEEKSDTLEGLDNDSIVEEKSDMLGEQVNNSVVEEKSDILRDLGIVEEKSDALGDLINDSIVEKNSDTMEVLDNDSIVEEKTDMLGDLGNDSIVEEKSDTFGDLGDDRLMEENIDKLGYLGNYSIAEEMSGALRDLGDVIVKRKSDTLENLVTDSIVEEKSCTLEDLGNDNIEEENSNTLGALIDDSIVEEKTDKFVDLGNDKVQPVEDSDCDPRLNSKRSKPYIELSNEFEASEMFVYLKPSIGEDQRSDDSQYDDVLLEFASDMGITLEPPEKLEFSDDETLCGKPTTMKTTRALIVDNVIEDGKYNNNADVSLKQNVMVETGSNVGLNDTIGKDHISSNLDGISTSKDLLKMEDSEMEKDISPEKTDFLSVCLTIVNQPITDKCENQTDFIGTIDERTDMTGKQANIKLDKNRLTNHQKYFRRNKYKGRGKPVPTKSSGTKVLLSSGSLDHNLESDNEHAATEKREISTHAMNSKVVNNPVIFDSARPKDIQNIKCKNEVSGGDFVTVKKQSLDNLLINNAKDTESALKEGKDTKSNCNTFKELHCSQIPLEKTELTDTNNNFKQDKQRQKQNIGKASKDLNNNCVGTVETTNSSGAHKTVVSFLDKSASEKVNRRLFKKVKKLNNNQTEKTKSQPKFYRCSKCNKLFHGVAHSDVNTCYNCEKMSVKTTDANMHIKLKGDENYKFSIDKISEKSSGDILQLRTKLDKVSAKQTKDKILETDESDKLPRKPSCEQMQVKPNYETMSGNSTMVKMSEKSFNDIVPGKPRYDTMIIKSSCVKMLGSSSCDKTSGKLHGDIVPAKSQGDIVPEKSNSDTISGKNTGSKMSGNSRCNEILENRTETCLKSRKHSPAEKPKGLKLILQKVKIPLVNAANNKKNDGLGLDKSSWTVRSIEIGQIDKLKTQGHPLTRGDTLSLSCEEDKAEKVSSVVERDEVHAKLTENKEEQMIESDAKEMAQPAPKRLKQELSSSRNSHVKEKTNKMGQKLNHNVKAYVMKSKYPEQNEFEKALMNGHRLEQKSKPRRKEVGKEKTIKVSKAKEVVNHVEDNRAVVQRIKSHSKVSASESTQPFQKSKIAQMIYNKHQKKQLNDDGLPDFSETKLDLQELRPLSVRAENPQSDKCSGRDSDTCSKVSEDSFSTKPRAMQGKDSAQISDSREYEICTDGYNSYKIGCSFSDESCLETNDWASDLADINRKKLQAVSVNERSDHKRNHLQELKKELEAIGIAKGTKRNDCSSGGCFSPVDRNITPIFSSPWKRQKMELSRENTKPVLPSFSDTFSKILSPRGLNHSSYSFSSVTALEKSESTGELKSGLNDGDEIDVDENDFTGRNRNHFETVWNSEHSKTVRKRELVEESEDFTFFQDPNNSSFDAGMQDCFIQKRFKPALNLSSTPQAHHRLSDKQKNGQSLDLNISSIYRTSPDRMFNLFSPIMNKRHIKSVEVPKNFLDEVADGKDKNCLEDTSVTPESMMILSAECSKMDMTNLPGPRVNLTSTYNEENFSTPYNMRNVRVRSNSTINNYPINKQLIFSNDPAIIAQDAIGMANQVKDKEFPKTNVNTPMDIGDYDQTEDEKIKEEETLVEYEKKYGADFISFDIEESVRDASFNDTNPAPGQSEPEAQSATRICDDESVKEIELGEENKNQFDEVESASSNAELETDMEDEEKVCSREDGSKDDGPPEIDIADIDEELGETLPLEKETHSDSDQDHRSDVWSVIGHSEKGKKHSEYVPSKENVRDVESVNEDKVKGGSSEDEDQVVEFDVESEGNKTDDVMEDILDLYASDEEAAFLLDSPLNLPVQSEVEENLAVKEDNEVKELVEKEVLRSPISVTGSDQRSEESSPVRDTRVKPKLNKALLMPLRSSLIKGRWVPRGWCFKFFTRGVCNPHCTFKHDPPNQDVLRRCIGEIPDKCRKGELDGAMNMLISHEYFMENLCLADLDRLYGCSINNLKIEYCLRLLKILSYRGLVKERHIDDVIFLWKRHSYSNGIEELKDVYLTAKQTNIFPRLGALQILLEAFIMYDDLYMLWDLISYWSQNEDSIICQEYINKAISLAACCKDTALLAMTLTWLEKVTSEQLTHINKEVLMLVKMKLHQLNMLKQLTVINKCLERKSHLDSNASLPRYSAFQTPHLINSAPSCSEQHNTLGQFGVSSLNIRTGQSRTTTLSCPDATRLRQFDTYNRNSRNLSDPSMIGSGSSVYSDSFTGRQHFQNTIKRGDNLAVSLNSDNVQTLPRLLTSKFRSKSAHDDELEAANVDSSSRVTRLVSHADRNVAYLDRCSRAVTPPLEDIKDLNSRQLKARTYAHKENTDSSFRGLRASTEMCNNSGQLASSNLRHMDQLKASCERRDWSDVVDIFSWCSLRGPINPEMFEQILAAILKDDSSVGQAWGDFVRNIENIQMESPGIKLNKHCLSMLGSEVFYYCYRNSSPDAKDVLLTIIDTEFLSLSPTVGKGWGVCLDFVAAEFLLSLGMAEVAAHLLLGATSVSPFDVDILMKGRSFIQPLVQELCKEDKHTLAFQVFCRAFKWKYKGLQKVAGELILSCLRLKGVEIPVQIYEMYLKEARHFDVSEAVKRSMLNALIDVNMKFAKLLYRDMTDDISMNVYLHQSLQKPRCIWLQSPHTLKEIKLIVGEYLQDLFNVLCEQVRNDCPLVADEVFLDVAVDEQVLDTSLSEMPCIGTSRGSLADIKQILLTEFGLESTFSQKGIVKLTIQPASLKKYLQTMEQD